MHGWVGGGGLNELRALSSTWHSPHLLDTLPHCTLDSLPPRGVSASGSVPAPRGRALTERCWNSQALMMFVATLGKMPLFLFRRRSGSSSSSSPPELGEATLVSSPSPEGGGACRACGHKGEKP